MALKLDGTVVQWGESFGSLPPSGLSGVLSLAAGQGQALALKSDGTVVGWEVSSKMRFPVLPG